MKKLIIVAGVLVGAGLVARRVGTKFQNMDWEKAFEAMPDNAPPKWMFRHISEIHDNTERILEVLEARSSNLGPAEHESPSDTGPGGN